MNEEFVMRPGDTFVAEECGCSFTVESGPHDEGMARQAPTCCCGHRMKKQGASLLGAVSRGDQGRKFGAISSSRDDIEGDIFRDAPAAMPD